MRRKRLLAATLGLSMIVFTGCAKQQNPQPQPTPTGPTAATENKEKTPETETANTAETGGYVPGTYEGVGSGFGSAGVKVTITVDESAITDVSVEGADETPDIGGKALEELANQIKTAQSADIDGVSGATLTSDGAREAAAAAIAAAKGGGEEGKEETPNEPLALTPGTYEGTASGFHGTMKVSVEVTSDAITKVTVGDNEETYHIGTRAFPVLEESIVENQSLADMVSGATISSRAIVTAVEEALRAAGATDGAIKTLKAKELAGENPGDTQTDVVIVGAGVAGMMAALAATDNGADVILLEKNGVAGGSALLSAGGILSVGAQECVEAGYDFTSEDVHRWYSIQAGPVNNDPVFYEIMNSTKDSVDYLRTIGFDEFTIGPNEPKLATNFRSMSTVKMGRGIGIGDRLVAAVMEKGVDMRYNSPVTGLVMEDGKVAGVTVESRGGSYTISAKKVILATGGYTYNEELMQTYSESYVDSFKITASGATGDGHVMGLAAGGHIIGEGVLQIYVAGYDPSLEGNQPGNVPLFVDEEGNQVCAADEYYGTIATKLHKLPNDFAWGIFSSDNTYVKFNYSSTGGMQVVNLDDYVEAGKFIKADTIEELAEKIGIEPDALARSVEEHNWFYDYQFNDAWGTSANALQPLKTGPYYATKEVFSVMGTVAGLEINTDMQVVDDNGQAVENLYAVGELIFGNVFNQRYPMSGTAIGICITSGKLAGQNAAEAVK